MIGIIFTFIHMFKFYMHSLNGVVSTDAEVVCFVFLIAMVEVAFEILALATYNFLKG